jgi:hypothetical protein
MVSLRNAVHSYTLLPYILENSVTIETGKWTWTQFKMIRDHALMIHYEKQNQQVHTQICKFIIL